jgi:predicted dehydrogenase
MSKKIKIGLIGVAHRAFIAENWHNDQRAEIVAGCDISQAYLKEFQDKYGRETFVSEDYKELLKRDDIDAIAIFTPDNFHAEPAIAAMKAGKDVFLEKPMAITIEACKEIIRAEKESGQKLMIGFNMRYMDYFKTMKNIIMDGTIGEIKTIWIRHFVNYGGWAYFHDYRANRKGSTSLLLQKASHDIDMAHFLIGEYFNRVIGMGTLSVYGGSNPNDLTCDKCAEKNVCPDFSDRSDAPGKQMCCFRREVDVEDQSAITMATPGGIIGTYMQCHFAPDNWRNYAVIGTRGRLESNQDESITLFTQKKNSTRNGNYFPYSRVRYEIGETEGGHNGADPKMCKAFLDYLIDDVKPQASSVDGLMAVAVGCKGTESIRNGNVPCDIKF